jgi:hypothetical protein
MGVKLVSHIKGRTQIDGFESRVLRRIFGPKREEMKGDQRKLYNWATILSF